MIEELFYHRSIPMTAALAATVRSNGRLLSSMPEASSIPQTIIFEEKAARLKDAREISPV
jgi:hypothetical protein